MNEELSAECLRGHPTPANGGVHDLKPAPVASPHHDKMRETAGETNDDDGRERVGLVEQDMTSNASMEVPSTSVWQASRSFP